MKRRGKKDQAKPITITVERMSDKSRITFTISSDKTIEELRALLNHHLPPLSPDKFDLYSYQRGALIHFHPSSFRLDYFPVIFDQSVLLLKMDDKLDSSSVMASPKSNRRPSKKRRISSFKSFFSMSNTVKRSPIPSKNTADSTESSNLTSCLSFFKQIFGRSPPTKITANNEEKILTY